MSKAEDHKIPKNVTVHNECLVSGIYCWKLTFIPSITPPFVVVWGCPHGGFYETTATFK